MNSEKNRKRTPFWFYIILILIPVLFFVILELALRVFNYGDDYTQWIKVTDSRYILNPDYSKKFFFSTRNAPYSNGNVFDVEKKSNAFRIFILGGSSAAGFPYLPNGDFGKYLLKRLEYTFPENKIEVVNLAITAVNSYTLRDIIPGVLEQKPDLILIYAGHNEYYGALGAGSLEYVGSSRSLVNFVIYLNNFKITQLVRNTLSRVSGLFASEASKQKGGTLMARMAKEQMIPYKSDIYNNGIEQFKGNMYDILKMTKDAGVPVILGTLTCNLKDQPPFVSVDQPDFPAARETFGFAIDHFAEGKIQEAESLFVLAKDLDALRFRAPSEINKIILKLSEEFSYPAADIYTGFNEVSPHGITGDNLMTDHLHPTLAGYQQIGKIFYNVMEQNKLLPGGKRIEISPEAADSIAISNYAFTDLDSTIARYRIIILKNDWPFSEPKTGMEIAMLFNVTDAIDSIAVKVVDNKAQWEEAHRMAAKRYLDKGDYENFTRELIALIDQFPFIEAYYSSSAQTLLEAQQFDLALNILYKKHKNFPDAFSAKWIGTIELSKGNRKDAIRYLRESLKYNSSDAQVLFNLSGALAFEREFKAALETVNRCLAIDPAFPGARELKNQLEPIVN